MEEETDFRRSATPDAMEDYRAAVADSTSNMGRGNEPIPIAYRQIPPNNNSTSTSTAGYVNGGQSINFRPQFPEPAEERGEGPVSLEVDFDNKMTDAYAKLDDVRDPNYHLVRGASYPQHSPDRMRNSLNPTYNRGIPNDSQKQKKQYCRSCFLYACLAVLIVTNFLALLVGGFNLANTYNVGTITSGTSPASSPQTQEGLHKTIQEVKQNLTRLQQNFNALSDVHSMNISFVKTQLNALQLRLDGLTQEPATTAEVSDVTTPLGVTAPTPKPFTSIPLYSNCTIKRKTVCTTSIVPDAAETLQHCITAGVRADTEPDSYVAEAFCSITNEQAKPVAASLSYSDGEWSCICQGVEITSRLENALMEFDCELYFRLCPLTLEIPWN